MKISRVFSFFARHRHVALVLFMLVLTAAPSFASSSGTALPWESPLTTVKNSLTGPVALAVSTCALFACGAVLVFDSHLIPRKSTPGMEARLREQYPLIARLSADVRSSLFYRRAGLKNPAKENV